ncbi:MAG: hypothetical protein JSU87_01515 [Gemmatimonadota bacterium]|nr:MAG: hypothetical protein JSU87_01515 [Gemmatimonadota bacterium]
MSDPAALNFTLGWVAMLAGLISGAAIGLYFHDEDWLGGYGSYQRRMLRLGHLALFALGIINVLFALSTVAKPIPDLNLRVASLGLMVGVVAMPTCCFLTAWRKGFRHAFPIPVLAVLTGLLALLLVWLTP